MSAGPFETEREAHTASRWEQLARPVQGAEPMREANLIQLLDACADAGVAVGAYDSRILHWLANYEPSTVAAVAGLITRASNTGLTPDQVTLVVSALRDAMDYRVGKSIGCPDCDAAEVASHRSGHPVAACERHQPDHEQADRYDELGQLLAAEAGDQR
jgi:hypothetical protein